MRCPGETYTGCTAFFVRTTMPICSSPCISGTVEPAGVGSVANFPINRLLALQPTLGFRNHSPTCDARPSRARMGDALSIEHHRVRLRLDADERFDQCRSLAERQVARLIGEGSLGHRPAHLDEMLMSSMRSTITAAYIVEEYRL